MAKLMGQSLILTLLQYTWITQVAYVPAIILTKIAVLGFFMKVFPARGFQLVCWGTVVHCAVFMVSTTIAAILACVPVEAAWTAWTGSGEGVCFDNNTFWWAHSVRDSKHLVREKGVDAKFLPQAINIATDVWILALPIPQLLNLQLGRKKKIYLIMMFSVGLV